MVTGPRISYGGGCQPASYDPRVRARGQARSVLRDARGAVPAPVPTVERPADAALLARRMGDDRLTPILACAVRRRATAPVLQRVHFPKLRGVDAHYAGEAESGAKGIKGAEMKIASCAGVYKLVAGKPDAEQVKITSRQESGLVGITASFDRATRSATLSAREWRAVLERWRDVFDEHYFARPSPAPAGYPGFVPRDFVLTPRHTAWLTEVLTAQGVRRDSAEDREASEVAVAGGRLVRVGLEGQPRVDTSAGVTWWGGVGWQMYVMSHDGRLHLASHVVGRRHHSSLLGANPDSPSKSVDAAAAGEMRVVDGKIEAISWKTGHYQAGVEQMRQVVHLLTKRGANLAGTRVLDHDNKEIAPDAREWWRTTGMQAYEIDKTLHALAAYRDKHGRAEVDAALKRAGWNRAVAPGSGRPIWVDAGGAQATAKQVRKALKAQFAGERAAPLTTVKGEAQPRQARSEAVDPVDPYAVRWPDVIAGIEALGLTPEGQRKVLLSLPGPRVAA